MSAAVHPTAARGFDRAADVYAASRPGYPRATADWLRDALGVGRSSRVAEVGAGTGLFTPLLIATGASVIAIDPVRAMLDRLAARLPTVETLVAPAQAVPLPEASIDTIVCATAFHWFASAETMVEFRRLLRPGGSLGLIWNTRDERVPWVAKLSAITNAHDSDVPRQGTVGWRSVFPAPGFSPLVETVMDYRHRGTVEDVIVGRTLSTSFIAALPPGAQAAVVAEVRALIAATPELREQANVEFPYVTKAYHCRRID